MAEVNWFALNREQQTALYPQLVRTVFHRTAVPSDVEASALLPTALGADLVQVEITTFCNLKCRECGRTKSVSEGTWVNRNLPLESYKKILSKLPPADRIYLQGVGEPSMHPSFEELVRLATESGKYRLICFNTNALPHKDEFWRHLAAKYPSVTPSISIDSLDPIIAERCRSGTNVELLFARLALFREIFPGLTVALVASKMNLEDIAGTLSKVAALGQGVLGIQSVITDDKSVALDEQDEARLREILEGSARENPQLQVHWGTRYTGLKRCISPFVSPFVNIEGYLTPCCALVDSAPFGRTSMVSDETWDEIRGSENVTKWMKDYLAGDPEPCRGCTFNPVRTERTRDRLGDRFAAESI